MNYLKALVILAFFVGVTFPADAVDSSAPDLGTAPFTGENHYYRVKGTWLIVIIREI